MSDNTEHDPATGAIAAGVVWGLIALWAASYWTTGGAQWIVAGLVAVCAGSFLYSINSSAQAAARQKRQLDEARRAALIAARAAAAPPEKLPELSAADLELVETLVRAYPGYLPRREGVVRETGRKLNERGGIKLMLRAHREIAGRLGGVAARELESAWDGIGAWMG